MNKFIRVFHHNFLLAAIVAAVSTLFFTLDSYLYNSVTTAFDIINIGGIRLEAMDFVYILFAVTCTAGMAVGFLLKKHLHRFASIMTVLLGVIVLVVAFVDVDLFQSLFPTMRISHVIMTLSQLIIIMLGASGFMVGAAVAYIVSQKEKLNKKVIIGSLLVGMALSVLAVSEHIYNMVYGIIAVFIILGTVIFQFNKEETVSISAEKFSLGSGIGLASNGFAIAALALIIGTMYNYLVHTVGMSLVGYIVIIASTLVMVYIGITVKMPKVISLIAMVVAAILAIVACFVQTLTITCLALLMVGYCVGQCIIRQPHSCTGALTCGGVVAVVSIISLAIIKSLSEEIKHSGNRIYYKVDASVFAIILAFIAAAIGLKLFHDYVITKKIKQQKAIENKI